MLHVCRKNIKIQGSGVPKSTKKPSKINAKIMPKNVMQKGRKIVPKRVQNGSQNRTKIGKMQKKGGPKIDAKNGCRKKAAKIANDAAKIANDLAAGSFRGRFWGAGGFGGNGETGFDSDPL